MIHINDDTDIALHLPPPGCKTGAIPRNYEQRPLGYYRSIPPLTSLPLLSDTDIQAAIVRKNAEKSWLTDLRDVGMFGKPVPSRDQNGKGYCVTDDTEVLTEKGWTPYPDYNYTDLLATMNPTTGLMEFQAPTHRHVYEYNGDMIYSTNRRIDFGVTPDHRMMVRKWDQSIRSLSSQYSFQKAGQLGWYLGLPSATSGYIGTDFVELEIEGDRRYDGDDFLALLSLVCSDGYAGGIINTKNWVSFSCFRENRRREIVALAQRLGFHESPSRRGVWIRYDAGALAAWLRVNSYTNPALHAENKKVPDLVKSASMRQIKHFIRFFGDQNHGAESQEVYYSTSKRLIDDLQELLLRVGRRGTIRERGPRTSTLQDGKVINSDSSFVMTVTNSDSLCIDKKKHIERDHYKGLVYCATVPNGTLITRRNGSVLISGNCWAHSGVSANLLVRARDNQPYEDLSAFAVACIIKNYVDEGGWGAEGITWQAENGVPTSKTWPQQSMSRSNDNAAMRAEAALYKAMGVWADIKPNDDRALATCLINDIPVVSDFNWWGHSVCAAKLVSWQPLSIIIWNSWGDSWSDNGMGLLSGSKASPDGMVALMTTRVSQ